MTYPCLGDEGEQDGKCGWMHMYNVIIQKDSAQRQITADWSTENTV